MPMTPCYRVGNNPYNMVLFYAYHLATRHQSAKMCICGNIAQLQICNRQKTLKHLAFSHLRSALPSDVICNGVVYGVVAFFLLQNQSESKLPVLCILHHSVPTLFRRFFLPFLLAIFASAARRNNRSHLGSDGWYIAGCRCSSDRSSILPSSSRL